MTAHQPQNTDIPLWSDAATARLAQVPAGSIRDMAHKAVSTLAKQAGVAQISVEFVNQILAVFFKGSTKVTEALDWDEAARAGISRAPEMVRGMLVKEIECWATAHDHNSVTLDLVNTVKSQWHNTNAFHLNPNDPRNDG